MRILLTDRTPASAKLGDRLRDIGHEVFADCLPDPQHQECHGLRTGTCPLDEGADLAITGIDRDQDVATAGVVCSRRRGVPVVPIGQHDADHPDLEANLERIARHGDELIAWTARNTLHELLSEEDVARSEVALRRDAGTERLVVRVPGPLTDAERSRIAVRLLAAATSTGRTSHRRDVIIQST